MNTFTMFAQAIPVAFAALFPVVNPLSTAIILNGMTGNVSNAMRKTIARKIACNAAILLILVLIAGSHILAFFGINIPVVQTGGGLVLASMGWNMLKQDDAPPDADGETGAPAKLGDLVFYPFTFPVTVGPGCIAVALTLSAHTRHERLVETAFRQLGAIVGTISVCVLVYVTFAYSDLLSRRLGPSGSKVLLRLMAFVVVCLGVEIFWNGASTLLRELQVPVAR